MKLEEQVVSLELAKKLRELGVSQESYFFWTEWKPFHLRWRYAWTLDDISGQVRDRVSAFTVAELGEMLPRHININHVFVGQLMSWRNPYVVYGTMKQIEVKQAADTEADARAKMLIYLLEAGLVQPEQLAASVCSQSPFEAACRQ